MRSLAAAVENAQHVPRAYRRRGPFFSAIAPVLDPSVPVNRRVLHHSADPSCSNQSRSSRSDGSTE
jgi:hypothetical protein